MGKGSGKSANRPVANASVATTPVATAEAYIPALFNKNSTVFFSDDDINPNKNQPDFVKYTGKYNELKTKLNDLYDELEKEREDYKNVKQYNANDKISSADKQQKLIKKIRNAAADLDNEFVRTNKIPLITEQNIGNMSTKNLVEVRLMFDSETNRTRFARKVVGVENTLKGKYSFPDLMRGMIARRGTTLNTYQKLIMDREIARRQMMDFANLFHKNNANKTYLKSYLKRINNDIDNNRMTISNTKGTDRLRRGIIGYGIVTALAQAYPIALSAMAIATLTQSNTLKKLPKTLYNFLDNKSE